MGRATGLTTHQSHRMVRQCSLPGKVPLIAVVIWLIRCFSHPAFYATSCLTII